MEEMLRTLPVNCSVLSDGKAIPDECLFAAASLAITPATPALTTDELDLLGYAASPVPVSINSDPWRVLCEQIFYYGLPMIIVSGFIFSLSSVLALSKQLESSTEVYLFTLALSNWLLLGTAGILNIESYTGRKNILQRMQIYCRALHEWLWYVSCWMVIVMTIECLVTVCQRRLTSLCSKSQALVLTVLVYATCLISVLPEFWAYEIRELVDVNTNTSIYRLYKSATMNTMEYNVMYYWYIQSITFLIPYPLLLITASVILRNGGTRCRIITTTIPAANAQINARGNSIVISHATPSPRLGVVGNGRQKGGLDFNPKKQSKGDYKNLYDTRGPSFMPQSNGNNLLVTIRQPDSEVQLNRSIIATSICYSVLTLPHVSTQFLLRNFASTFKAENATSSQAEGYDGSLPITVLQGSQMVFRLFFYAQFGLLFLLLVCHMERFRQSLARVCCSCCMEDDSQDEMNQDVAAIEPVARLDLTNNGQVYNHPQQAHNKVNDLEANGGNYHPHWSNSNGAVRSPSAHYQNGHAVSYQETMNGTMNGNGIKPTKPLKPIIKNSRTPPAKCTSPMDKVTGNQQESETNGLVVMQSTV